MLGRGDQPPALFFIHGGLCDSTDWDVQVQALERCRPVAIDLPGHGQSRLPSCGSLERMGDSVAALQRGLAAEPAILVGHGFGCVLAVETWRRNPQAVLGLIMIEGHPLAPATAAALPPPDTDIDELRSAIANVFESMFSPAVDPALREHVLAHVQTVEAKLLRDLGMCLDEWNREARARLEALDVPLLLVEAARFNGGRFGPLLADEPAAWTSFVSALQPSAEVVRLADSGHLAQIETPGGINALISRFYDRHARPRGG